MPDQPGHVPPNQIQPQQEPRRGTELQTQVKPPTLPQLETRVDLSIKAAETRLELELTLQADIEREFRAHPRGLDIGATIVQDLKFKIFSEGLVRHNEENSQELDHLARVSARKIADFTLEIEQARNQLFILQSISSQVYNGTMDTFADVEENLGILLGDPETRRIAQDAFASAIETRNQRRVNVDNDPQKYLKALGSKQNITVGGLTRLANADNLLGYIQDLRGPKLGQGMTIDEMRTTFANAGIASEFSAPLIQDAEDFRATLRQQAQTSAARWSVWRSELMNAVENGEFAKVLASHKGDVSLFSQPGLFIGLPIKFFDEHYAKPIGGAALGALLQLERITPKNVGPIAVTTGFGFDHVRNFFGLDEEHYLEFQNNFVMARQDGANVWMAYGAAFEQQEINTFAKILLELGPDPMTYFGFGITNILRPVPVLGRAAIGLETAFTRASDLGFIAIQKGLAKSIPKLPKQIIDRDAVGHLQPLFDYLNNAIGNGDSFRNQSMPRIKQALQEAAKTLDRHPGSAGDMTDAVRGLLERPLTRREDVASLGQRLGKTISPDDLDEIAFQVDTLLSHSREIPGGITLVEGESIDALMAVMRADITKVNRDVIRGFIRRDRTAALSAFDEIISKGEISEFMDAVLDRRRFILTENSLNPLNPHRSRTGMLMAGMMSNNMLSPAITTATAGFGLARRFSQGAAKMYLMSTFYGPGNIIEVVGKTVALSMNPFWHGDVQAKMFTLAKGFEADLPSNLLLREGIIQQLPGVTNAGRAAPGARASRGANKRAITEKRNIFQSMYHRADQAFIQSHARISRLQNVNVMNGLIERREALNAITGPVHTRITSMVESASQPLLEHMDSNIFRQTQNQLFNLAFRSPDDLATMAATFTAGHGHAANLQEIASQFDTLDPLIGPYIVEKSISGELPELVRSGQFREDLIAHTWQSLEAEPAVYLARIRGLVREIVDMPVDTLDGLRAQTELLRQLNETTVHSVSQQVQAAEAQGRDILDLVEKDDFWKGQWETIIQPVISSGQEAADEIVASLRKSLEQAGFDISARERGLYEDLLTKELNRVQVTTEARTSVNDFMDDMIFTRDHDLIPAITRREGKRPNAQHPEIVSWWRQVHAGRARLWDEANTRLAFSAADLDATKAALGSQPLPPAVDVSTRPLVMSDVAYLYGAAPDSVTQGLYLAEMKAIRPRKEWVEVVHGQANRIAQASGETAESIGFDRVKLNALFDDYIKSVRGMPGVNEISQPRFAELDNFMSKVSTYMLGSSMIIKPSASKALDDVAKQLLRDIGEDDIAREVLTTKAVREISPARKRSIEELTEAGGGVQVDSSVLPDEVARIVERGQTIEQAITIAERFGEEARADVELLNRVTAKIRQVQDDAAEFSSREIEFLEDLGIEANLLHTPSDFEDATRIITTAREESVSAISRAEGRLAQIVDASDQAKADAIDRGITAIGIEEPAVTVTNISDTWTPKRGQAIKEAIDEYNVTFPVPDNNNAFNAAAKFVFPFWHYEAHRVSYLPKFFVQHPGAAHAWGTYNANTDRGYIPIPGLGQQINIMNNSIMSGGLNRLLNRDYPEFYDQVPGFANVLDNLGKIGFFPNIYGTAFLASPFANKEGIWQTGQIIPPVIGTPLEVIIAIDPDNALADALADIILPSGFRDFRVAVRMAGRLPKGQEARAGEILGKRFLGEELTEEEQAIWDGAERWAARDIAIGYQAGYLRIRPESLVAARELSKEIILRYVPVTSEQYDEAIKRGIHIEELYPFPEALNDALRSVAEIGRWRGLSTQLRESGVAAMLFKQRSYWEQIETRREEQLLEEAVLEERYKQVSHPLGHISRKQMDTEKRKLDTELRLFREELKASDDFKDVPIDYDDRVQWAVDHNSPAPIQNEVEEAITEYFSKQPEDFTFFDGEIGQTIIDWTGFGIWRKVLLSSLGLADQEAFNTRIRKFETDLERFRREDYETFINPYTALFDITLQEHAPNEQAVIREFYATDSINVTKELKEVETPEGRLISQFQSVLNERRSRFRVLDPEMDARLAFYGRVSSVKTPAAQAIYDNLFDLYGVDARETVSITREPITDVQDLTDTN